MMDKLIDIPGYEKYYAITPFGNIWSKTKRNWMHFVYTKKGYFRVTFNISGKLKSHLVHRLVLLTFKGKSDLPCNHIDGSKVNNHISNLEYCTNKENQQHAIKLGLSRHLMGEQHPNSKLTLEQVRFIKYADKNIPAIVLKRELNLSSVHVVYDIRRGKTWSDVV